MDERKAIFDLRQMKSESSSKRKQNDKKVLAPELRLTEIAHPGIVTDHNVAIGQI